MPGGPRERAGAVVLGVQRERGAVDKPVVEDGCVGGSIAADPFRFRLSSADNVVVSDPTVRYFTHEDQLDSDGYLLGDEDDEDYEDDGDEDSESEDDSDSSAEADGQVDSGGYLLDDEDDEDYEADSDDSDDRSEEAILYIDSSAEADGLGGGIDDGSSGANEESELAIDEDAETKASSSDDTGVDPYVPSDQGSDVDEEKNNADDPPNAMATQQLGSVWVTQDSAALDLTLREAMYDEMELEEERKRLQAQLERATAWVEVKQAEVRALKLLLGDHQKRPQRSYPWRMKLETTNFVVSVKISTKKEMEMWKVTGDIVHDVDHTQENEAQDHLSEQFATGPSFLVDFSTKSVADETLYDVNLNRGRYLCVNPSRPCAIATSGLAGGHEIWEYNPTPRTLSWSHSLIRHRSAGICRRRAR